MKIHLSTVTFGQRIIKASLTTEFTEGTESGQENVGTTNSTNCTNGKTGEIRAIRVIRGCFRRCGKMAAVAGNEF
jgi:hypothetical protein